MRSALGWKSPGVLDGFIPHPSRLALQTEANDLRAVIQAAEAQTVNVQNFLRIVKKYTEPTELTPALLHEFIERIVIHEPDKSSGHRIQRIDVHYNFIGEIDLSPEFRRCNIKTAT